MDGQAMVRIRIMGQMCQLLYRTTQPAATSPAAVSHSIVRPTCVVLQATTRPVLQMIAGSFVRVLAVLNQLPPYPWG
jgi:hypothetical protein